MQSLNNNNSNSLKRSFNGNSENQRNKKSIEPFNSVASEKVNQTKMASSVTMDNNGKALMDLNSPLEVSDNMKNQRGQNERKSQQILPLNKKIIKPMSSHKNMGHPSNK